MFPTLLTLCVLFAGWSFLSVLGNERQRKLREIEDARPKADQDAEPPVGDEVAR